MSLSDTRYGFKWHNLEVTRLAHFTPRKGQQATVLGITTPRAQVEVTVSKTGLVRVHLNGRELS